MKKKRIFAFLLTIIMLAGFCGCSASAKGLISQRRLDDMLAKGETFWAEQKTHEIGETVTVTDYVRPLSYILQYPRTGFPETDARIETIVSDIRNAFDQGLNLIDAGHFYTENPAMAPLAEKLRAQFPEISVELAS